MKHAIDTLNAHPKYVGILGTVAGWAGFDFLRAAQIGAAALACLVSLCSLILIAPKAMAEVKRWLNLP